MRRRVYIAGPISKGNLADNVNQATEAFIELAQNGIAPMCPHWSVYAKACDSGRDTNTREIDDRECVCYGTVQGNPAMNHADWLGIDLSWVAVSHAVLRLPGESVGADVEVAEATNRGIPVFTSIGELLEHKRSAWD